jgi:hypothetical protein
VAESSRCHEIAEGAVQAFYEEAVSGDRLIPQNQSSGSDQFSGVGLRVDEPKHGILQLQRQLEARVGRPAALQEQRTDAGGADGQYSFPGADAGDDAAVGEGFPRASKAIVTATTAATIGHHASRAHTTPAHTSDASASSTTRMAAELQKEKLSNVGHL